MIISLNSLRLFLSWQDDELIKNIINHQLIEAGFELEETTIIKKNWSGLIVGKLMDLQPVENSNKLNLCTVFDGKNNLSIVCGGSGLEINKNYILAPIGAKVGDLLITERKVFNNLSQGMLCGWQEININYPHMTLIDDDFIPGTPMENLYDIDFYNDEIYNINITPNRPDCLSIIGLAREIIAQSNGLITWKNVKKIMPQVTLENSLEINVETEHCYGFYTTIVKNVNNYTPLWLKIILQNLGFKSINLPVDINNFLLAKYGYPSHVYNYNAIDHTTVTIVKQGEFLGLDDKNYSINCPTLVLKNKEILCLLGLLGGKNSCYNSNDLILEIGHFNHQIINNTVKHLKINTQSGYVNSRWTDPLIIYTIIEDFLALLNNPYLNNMTNNITVSNTKNHCTNCINYNLSSLELNKEIFLPSDLWYKVAGYPLSIDKQLEYLNLLGFKSQFHKIEKNDGSNNYILGILAIAPHWRQYDIKNSYNLIEEIIRLDGINKYNSLSVNKIQYQQSNNNEKQWVYTTIIENILINLNYKQIITNPFTLNPSSGIQILQSNTYLQSNLRENLIKTGHQSLDKGYKLMNIFEIGEIFIENQELISLGGLFFNNNLTEQQLFNKGKNDIIFIINNLNQRNNNSLISFKQEVVPDDYNQVKSCTIYYNDKSIGHIGILHYKYNLELPMIIWEIFDINTIINHKKTIDNINNLSIKNLDISFFINEKVDINFLIKKLYEVPSIINIDIIDIYEKENKSYTLKIYWQYSNNNNDSNKMFQNLSFILINYNCILR